MNRTDLLQRAQQRDIVFDIIIIGGGATGLGAAVDAASRGHSVLLVEQHDFAKGTSSRSTKLVHGGVRYLKQGNISLVLEALRERGLLCNNAPHLVHPLAFVIPSYHWWEGPFYGIGLKVYDALAGKLGLEHSRFLSVEEVKKRLPTIETEHLTGGVVYHDGQFDDARLAIALACTAVEQGAVVVNYVRCDGFLKDGEHVTGVRLTDGETGVTFEAQGLCVINATGVFVDALRAKDQPTTSALVSPSQGVHLVLPREFLPGASAIMIPKTDDGRVLFAVPWHGCVIVGTTDTAVPEASLEPRALEEEIEFILTHAARYLTRDPKRSDVLSVFAGLRPLVKHGEGASTAALSRDHVIDVSASGLITITGGKWTTYRKMAEDVVDHAETIGCLEHRRCITHTMPLHGWTHALEDDEHLRGYGSEAASIRELMHEDHSLRELLHPRLPYQRAEVIWHVRQEMARTVEDVLARRTRALLLDARASMEAADEVARLMGKELGWDETRCLAEAERYRELARGYVLA